ncbi:U3 snoRNP-associated protein Nan1 [Schizosaccharomyces cryophilus OY26]|uniref:U3 snoRNP-associated protein Nan1 n=1 Tax=Schizosaccharomyces cryophilus (strain OY26 / ATCC MYA-4695 / CBS 11777 / NBRC 106824 / NRRL Y48691) TaxID=653667 RepID=S9W2E6_SCHCR|nr:U3 snoRNP-associated protein Nan1 [Schizosaccharomyces cryophilus OY26]EPY52574.1 U3 snoRNP-associated protein Nan1 [Schizosaccharomyces cryophilus OY26]
MEEVKRAEKDSSVGRKEVKDPWTKRAYLGGHMIPQLPAIYSNDNKFLFITYDTFVGIFSLITGECVNRIFFTTQNNDSTPLAVLLSPQNAFELYLVFRSGFVCVHDWATTELLRTMEISTRVHAATFSGNTLFAVTDAQPSKSGPSSERFILYALLPSISEKSSSLNPTFIFKFNDFIALSSSETSANLPTVAVLTNDKVMFAVNVPKKKKHQSRWEIHEHKFNQPQALTHISVHETKVAVADNEGRIHVFSDFTSSRVSGPRIMHWHANPLGGLTWALDGEYLVSGGQEGVLVLWTLETSHRQFLPRLGSSIDSISVSHNSDSYALHLGDNSLTVIKAVDLTEQIHVRGIHHMIPGPSDKMTSEDDRKAIGELFKFSTVNRRGELMLLSSSCFNGHFVALQQYDLKADACIRNFEVARYSYGSVSKTAAASPANETGYISSIAVACSNDDSYIATLDCWTTNTVDQQQRKIKQTALKFWQFDTVAKTWKLMTRIDQPHDNNQDVLGLISTTTGNKFVTLGTDATLRVWTLSSRTWVCSAMRRFANIIGQSTYSFSHALTNSLDGSIIAFGFDACVHLVHSETLETIFIIEVPHGGPIENIKFLGEEYLVIVSQRRLMIWNVVSMTAQWTVSGKFTGLLATSQNGQEFAVVDTNSSYSRLLIFACDYPNLLSMHIYKNAPLALHFAHGAFLLLDDKSALHAYGGTLASKVPAAKPSVIEPTKSLLGDFKYGVSAVVKSNTNAANVEPIYKRLTASMVHNLFNLPSTAPVDMEGMYHDFSQLAVGEPLGSLGSKVASMSSN